MKKIALITAIASLTLGIAPSAHSGLIFTLEETGIDGIGTGSVNFLFDATATPLLSGSRALDLRAARPVAPPLRAAGHKICGAPSRLALEGTSANSATLSRAHSITEYNHY